MPGRATRVPAASEMSELSVGKPSGSGFLTFRLAVSLEVQLERESLDRRISPSRGCPSIEIHQGCPQADGAEMGTVHISEGTRLSRHIRPAWARACRTALAPYANLPEGITVRLDRSRELCRIGCRAAIDADPYHAGVMPVGSISVASVIRTETGNPGSNPAGF